MIIVEVCVGWSVSCRGPIQVLLPGNWREFFETESAQERRRQYEAQGAEGTGAGAQELLPITCTPPRAGSSTAGAEPGVRLLQSVSVSPKVSVNSVKTLLSAGKIENNQCEDRAMFA